jgi:phosphatidylglycerol:prolipoprotein diacylglycerol transferase
MKKAILILAIIGVIFLIYFFFVPAFRGDIAVSPIIQLGFFHVRWYGIILAIAILVAYFLARKNSWKFGISISDIDDFSFWAVIVGIVGARVYYVLFNYSYYLGNWSEVYKIWHGGMSIYGALIAGIILGIIYARGKAYTFWQLFDLIALSLPLAQAVGRLGNFVNQEAFGLPTALPWKMYVAPNFRPEEFAQSQFFHPAFLYEAIWSVVIFFVLYKVLRNRLRNFPGLIGWTYLFLYSLGRFFVEWLRVDSFWVAGFRVDQVVALVLFIISGSMIFLKQKVKET